MTHQAQCHLPISSASIPSAPVAPTPVTPAPVTPAPVAPTPPGPPVPSWHKGQLTLSANPAYQISKLQTRLVLPFTIVRDAVSTRQLCNYKMCLIASSSELEGFDIKATV